MALKLGKLAPRKDPRTLRLRKYLTALPKIPRARNWTTRMPADFGMMLNSDIGDCTCAAAGHAIQVWTANATGGEVTIPDDAVLAAYEAVGGYTPSDPSTDQGAVALDVLKYWRKTGIGGHKIGAFVQLDLQNITHICAAINLFGGVYLGIALPLTAEAQIGSTWKVASLNGDGAVGSWGGHAIWVPAFTSNSFTCITWGARQTMSRNFWWAYADEAYAVLSEDFLSAGRSPDGFDLAALTADLVAVTG